MSGKKKDKKKKDKDFGKEFMALLESVIQKSVPVEPENAPTGEGATGFMLVPRDNDDGTPAKMNDDERRRQATLRYLVEKAAKEHGLVVTPEVVSEAPAPIQDERSQQITEAANPKMSDAAVAVRRRNAKLKVTTPDGTTIESKLVETEINARAAVADTLKAVADVVVEPLKWSGRLSIKCGKWLKAKVGAGSESQDGK